MNLRISAAYAATDGRAPESIDVSWDEIGPDEHPSATEIVDVIEMLARVPAMSGDRPAAHEDTTLGLREFRPDPARTYRAGFDIPAGVVLGWSADFTTIYPTGHPDCHMAGAGVSIEAIPAGAVMVHHGRGMWRKGHDQS